MLGRTRNDTDIRQPKWRSQSRETIRHGSNDSNFVRAVVQATIKFGDVKCIAVQMLMSVRESRKKSDCAFVALVTIIEVNIVKGRRNVGLLS